MGEDGTPSLGDALRLALENRDHPDINELLRSTYGTGKERPWDLDEELTTLERYFALFEALNWAVSLDDRLTEAWPFEENTYGPYWCDDFAGGGLIRGLRYARNAVHHDWSLALDIDPIEVPFRKRIELLWLAWAPGPLSEERGGAGASAYGENLAGRSVGDTLLEINELLETAARIATGGLPRRGSGPSRIKRSADDHYRPDPP